jgi:hypothetical protein
MDHRSDCSPAADVRPGVELQPGVPAHQGLDDLWRADPEELTAAATAALPGIASAAR